jgi:RimJ/RimL family protein N-acetyltransferase
MFGQDGAGKEQQTARRWWRRLREEEGAAGSDVGEDPAIGAIVREGERVRLRRHVSANRGAFQRWYADHDIARLLRHELKPLTYVQSLVYFDTSILPSSARGLTCAIHDRETDELIGTTGLTDLTSGSVRGCYFRIVIGESRYWGQGYGTEATRLMMREAFERHDREVVHLEVFAYNERAIRAYERVGFAKTGEHTEYPSREGEVLRVIEMSLRKDQFQPDPEPAQS